MSVEYSREFSPAVVICLWAGTALASWVLVGFAVAGIWWLVT